MTSIGKQHLNHQYINISNTDDDSYVSESIKNKHEKIIFNIEDNVLSRFIY